MKAKEVIINYSRDGKFLDNIFQTSLRRLSEICLEYDGSIGFRYFMGQLIPCQLVLGQCDYLDIFHNNESTFFANELGANCTIVEKDGYEIHYYSHRSYILVLYVFDKVLSKVVNFKNNNNYKEYETLKLFMESCVQK